MRFEVFANLVFKDDFGVDGCGHWSTFVLRTAVLFALGSALRLMRFPLVELYGVAHPNGH